MKRRRLPNETPAVGAETQRAITGLLRVLVMVLALAGTVAPVVRTPVVAVAVCNGVAGVRGVDGVLSVPTPPMLIESALWDRLATGGCCNPF